MPEVEEVEEVEEAGGPFGPVRILLKKPQQQAATMTSSTSDTGRNACTNGR